MTPHLGALGALCRSVFDGFDEASLAARLARERGHDLWIARSGGAPVGFKLGYDAGNGVLYSWLGGVVPAARRLGVARELMRLQHDAARAAGYRAVETRTRTGNAAMIGLNRACGFETMTEEIGSSGASALRQRKRLQISVPGARETAT